MNVPVGSSVYRDLERLEVKGLLKGTLLTTRPLSRLEVARVIEEAEEALGGLDVEQRRGEAERVIKRLKGKFGGESDKDSAFFLKPVESLNAKLLYADRKPHFASVNNDGDAFNGGLNLRARYALTIEFADAISIYASPEYRHDEDASYGELVHGYIKLDIGNITLQGGRDSMWWGAGFHGGLLITNNAKPLDMVKLTVDRPALLPWLFGYLGPFRPTVFLARLEEARDFPHANLFGMRLDFKPLRSFQFALNRVFMFGGEGSRHLDFNDWLDVFVAADSAEHSASAIDGNQIASIDASYVFVSEWKYLPFSGVKLYTEWGAEDSSGETKTPTGRANICGIYIDEPFWLESSDFRVEWANTARNERYGPLWYRHGKYSTGYTYEGRVIGHHMGSDSQDLFLRAQYYLKGGSVIGIEADRERSGVHSSSAVKRRWLGADFEYHIAKWLTILGGVGYEETPDDTNTASSTVSWIKTDWSF